LGRRHVMLEVAYFSFLLIVLALLIAYLHFSIEKRARAKDAPWLAGQTEEEAMRQAQWRDLPGQAFQVSAIAPQLERLRRDYLAAPHCRPRDTFHRKGLLAAARKSVTTLSYFDRLRPEKEMAKHDDQD